MKKHSKEMTELHNAVSNLTEEVTELKRIVLLQKEIISHLDEISINSMRNELHSFGERLKEQTYILKLLKEQTESRFTYTDIKWR